MRGVQFEDNVSFHNRESVFEFWKERLSNFEPPRFVPKNMAKIIQVVDLHLGIRYKIATYNGFRKKITKRIKQAEKQARKDKDKENQF